MKTGIIYALLPLVLLGCSKKANEALVRSQPSPIPQTIPKGAFPGIPFAVTFVETPETREVIDISNRTEMWLAVKDYDDLDAFAKKLRDSKECYADGAWKLKFIYDGGLKLPEGASATEWTAHLAALEAWTNARPDSITARVALAYSLVLYAWNARGDGLADTVTDQGWRLFNQRLNEAVTVLDEAKPLPQQCPYWWNVRLITELGLSTARSQYDQTFEAATRDWPDYENYYTRRAYYLFPRWYGTEGEWESDLGNAADKTGDNEGDLLYARVVWQMHQCGFFTNIFKECNLSWPRVDKGFAVV